ncbi:hypothetical protein [Massilia sp. TS11]|uniref:hypothetical protein n=1 Tax=Massilia sp. TS11 TaxID=2908003 RepID=UPI0027D95F25|nr:hypothetical protein [Massilia sp. TS11]
MAAVLDEIYSGKAQGADGEPASAALRFGYDDGLMYVAEISAGGHVRFEEWSDRDCEIALADPRTMQAGRTDAMKIWRLLAQRQVAKIRDLAWQNA